MHQIFEARYQIKEFEPNITSPTLFTTPRITLTFNYLQTGIVKNIRKIFGKSKKRRTFAVGKVLHDQLPPNSARS